MLQLTAFPVQTSSETPISTQLCLSCYSEYFRRVQIMYISSRGSSSFGRGGEVKVCPASFYPTSFSPPSSVPPSSASLCAPCPLSGPPCFPRPLADHLLLKRLSPFIISKAKQVFYVGVYPLQIPLPATLSSKDTTSISFSISVFLSDLPSTRVVSRLASAEDYYRNRAYLSQGFKAVRPMGSGDTISFPLDGHLMICMGRDPLHQVRTS
jgi:hypothetical protein